jgi:hypothetical protein
VHGQVAATRLRPLDLHARHCQGRSRSRGEVTARNGTTV